MPAATWSGGIARRLAHCSLLGGAEPAAARAASASEAAVDAASCWMRCRKASTGKGTTDEEAARGGGGVSRVGAVRQCIEALGAADGGTLSAG
jgi:hypothetical protein